MKHQSGLFWVAVGMWTACIWAWAFSGYAPVDVLAKRYLSWLIPSTPEWAQFWASVIGLVVAIAIPTWLHLRDRRERQLDRMNRARANAIGMVGEMLIFSVAFRAAQNGKPGLEGAFETPAAHVDRVSKALDLAPKYEDYGARLSELGPATPAVQRYFELLEHARALLVITTNVEVTEESAKNVRQAAGSLADMAMKAQAELKKLFS